MDLENKKDHICNLLILGMDFKKCCYAAQCTDDEIKVLSEDKVFQRRITMELALYEKSLLNDHKKASTIAMERGNAAPIQWMLSKINPERWGHKTAEPEPDVPNPVGFTTVGADE